MFGFGNKNPVKAAKALEKSQVDAGETPAPAGYNNVTQIYYAAFHASDAALSDEKKTKWVLMLLLGFAIGGYYFVWPLKRIETRYIEVETVSGRAIVSKGPSTALAELPERLQLKLRQFFLREFVSALVSLDARTVKERIPMAASMLQGSKAENAFKAYVYDVEKIPEKIANNPSLTREFVPKGDIAYSADGKQAFVRFFRVEKINGQEQNTTPMMATIEFVMLPEEPGKEKDLNPIGLRVLYFTIAIDQ